MISEDMKHAMPGSKVHDTGHSFNSPRFNTRAVHAGREDLRTLGVHALPIDLSTTYPFTDLDEAGASLDQLVEGCATASNPVYARLANPTTGRFERALADLESAEAGVAFSSGMAAFTAVLMAVAQESRHVVAVRPVYGTTDHLLSSGLLPLDVSWVEQHEIGNAIRPDTGLVIIETPANPTLKLVDIAACVAQAGPVPVLVDSTFATPVLQQPLLHGATMVLHSATKFIGGHGDVLAGVVATNDTWARRLRQMRLITGSVLHPLASYLLHRGLTTLPVRVKAAQATARMLVSRLLDNPLINKVYYPGLGEEEAAVYERQMAGPGTMIGFEVSGGFEMASAVLRHVGLITPAVSLGSVDSLIQHPASLTHRVVSEEGRMDGGINGALLRLSVGLEAAEDLWQDLEQALKKAENAPVMVGI